MFCPLSARRGMNECLRGRKRAPLLWYLLSPLNHLSRHHFLARRDARTCARYSQTHVQSLRKRLRSRTLMILQERAPTTLRLASGIFTYTTEQRNILSCALGRLEYTSLTWTNTSESITSFRIIPHTSCIVMCRPGKPIVACLLPFDPLPRVISRVSSSSQCYMPLLMSTAYLHGYLVCRSQPPNAPNSSRKKHTTTPPLQ